VGSIKNKRRKHSLPINSINFKKVLRLGLELGLGLGLVLVSKDSRVHSLNHKQCVVLVFLYCASYYRQDMPEGQLCRYSDFGVFRPAGATRCTDQGQIWQLLLAKFDLDRFRGGVYGPQN